MAEEPCGMYGPGTSCCIWCGTGKCACHGLRVAESKPGTWGVWYREGEGDRYHDDDGRIGFTFDEACRIAQRIGRCGIRKVRAEDPPGGKD